MTTLAVDMSLLRVYHGKVEITRLCFSVCKNTRLVLRAPNVLGLLPCVTANNAGFVGVRTFTTALNP